MDKSTFLYTPGKDGKDTGNCRSCKMFLKQHGICSLHGPKVKINGGMSCGLWVTGGPAVESEMEHVSVAVTPKESGLIEAEVRCVNCEYYKDSKKECLLFEILGIEDHTVEANGCCNAWHAEKEGKKEEKKEGIKRTLRPLKKF